MSGIVYVAKAAQGLSMLPKVTQALSQVAITANALAKIGDVTALAGFLTNDKLDAAKLAKAGLSVEVVNGQSVIKSAKDATITAEMISSLESAPRVASFKPVATAELLKAAAPTPEEPSKADPAAS